MFTFVDQSLSRQPLISTAFKQEQTEIWQNNMRLKYKPNLFKSLPVNINLF